MQRVRVVKVVDGDTVHVIPYREGNLKDDDFDDVIKVRLKYIDAPESKQEYGVESTAALNDLLFPSKLIYLESEEEPDKYGRTLGRLWTMDHDLSDLPKDRKDVNYLMVHGGHAWVYRKYKFPAHYDQAEQYAKSNKPAMGRMGNLWANAQAEPPWEWRKRHRKTRGRKHSPPRYIDQEIGKTQTFPTSVIVTSFY